MSPLFCVITRNYAKKINFYLMYFKMMFMGIKHKHLVALVNIKYFYWNNQFKLHSALFI